MKTDQEKFAAYIEFTMTDDHRSNPILTFGEWCNAGKPEAPQPLCIDEGCPHHGTEHVCECGYNSARCQWPICGTMGRDIE